jgi:hypothetical protein
MIGTAHTSEQISTNKWEPFQPCLVASELEVVQLTVLMWKQWGSVYTVHG